MSDPTVSQYAFGYRDLATLLVKAKGVHEGLWCVHFRFGLKAANFGNTDNDLLPTALVGVVEVGIQRVPKATNLTIDAAEVNPAPKTPKGAKKKGRA